jgi:hypothetical protein
MQMRAAVLFLSFCLPILSVGCAHELSQEQSLTQGTRRAEQLKAWQLSQNLKGYAALRESFELDNAILGLINGFPNSLHVDLRTTNLGPPNAVWWWNPLDEEGNPLYDWDTFLRVHQEASKVLIKHPWILEWRDAGPGRLVELHVFGIGIGETVFKLNTFILPVWREAGFAGQPTYSLLLRRGDKEWATLYLGTEQTRALVTHVSQPEESPAHWLDGLEVYYHPRCKPDDKSSRYVLVQPNGQWEIHAVRACEP